MFLPRQYLMCADLLFLDFVFVSLFQDLFLGSAFPLAALEVRDNKHIKGFQS